VKVTLKVLGLEIWSFDVQVPQIEKCVINKLGIYTLGWAYHCGKVKILAFFWQASAFIKGSYIND